MSSLKRALVQYILEVFNISRHGRAESLNETRGRCRISQGNSLKVERGSRAAGEGSRFDCLSEFGYLVIRLVAEKNRLGSFNRLVKGLHNFLDLLWLALATVGGGVLIYSGHVGISAGINIVRWFMRESPQILGPSDFRRVYDSLICITPLHRSKSGRIFTTKSTIIHENIQSDDSDLVSGTLCQGFQLPSPGQSESVLINHLEETGWPQRGPFDLQIHITSVPVRKMVQGRRCNAIVIASWCTELLPPIK